MNYLRTLIVLTILFMIGCGGGGPIAPNQTNPVADFSSVAPYGYFPGRSIVFDASLSVSPVSKIISYTWDWGDGSAPETYSVASSAHTYSRTDNFKVKLTVLDDVNGIGTLEKQIEIVQFRAGSAPTSCFDYKAPDGWQPGSEMVFDASCSTDPDGDTLSYVWHWEDGNSSDPQTSPLIKHTFISVSDKNVTLTVRDAAGWESVSEVTTIPIGYPLHPEFVCNLHPSNDIDDIDFQDNIVYALTARDGLQTMRLSESNTLEVTGQEFTCAVGTDIAVLDGHAYVTEAPQMVSDPYQGFLVFDVRDPYKLRLTSSFKTGYSYSVAVSKGYAYVISLEDYVIQIFDISDPAVPKSIPFSSPSTSDDLTCTSDTFYCTATSDHHPWHQSGEGLVSIFDRKDPVHPVGAATIHLDTQPADIAVDNRYLYILRNDDTDKGILEIHDLIDPQNPSLVGSLANLDLCYGMQVVGKYAYIAGGLSGILIVDISDIANPTIVASIKPAYQAQKVKVFGNMALTSSTGFALPQIAISMVKLW